MSCVLRISTGQQSALLVGDIEQPQELRIVADVLNNANYVNNAFMLKSDVLLVPHHGSKTSSSAEFLDAVKPQLAVVQAGYRNRFGHPVASVVARYNDRHIKVIDTAHCGALSWSSATPQETTCQRKVGMRYWHHQVP
jgi:competence protein ComEC